MKILIFATTGSRVHEIREDHLQKLREVNSNIEVIAIPAGDEIQISQHLPEAEVIGGNPHALPVSFAQAKKLKWIQLLSAGVDKVLTPEVKQSDILLTNVSGVHVIPIAEHVLGFLLLYTRKFKETLANQREGIWRRRDDVTELRGKTVCIAGLGRIGTEIARVLDCLGVRMIGVDVPGKEKPSFLESMYTTQEWNKALSQADFVVLSLPYTLTTHHLFGKEKFAMMKPSSVFVNIGRGAVVNEPELIEALEHHTIAGAALDVTEQEPLSPESPLWTMPNVVITPHQSGHSEKMMDRAFDMFAENLRAYLNGQKMNTLVDKERVY